MQKATRLLGKLDEVTDKTQLVHPVDAQRVIDGVDDRMRPCTRNEAATLVAQLIGAYPDIAMMRDDPSTSKDFALYTLKLHEAFSQFSYAIGQAIVHGGTGLPSKSPYRPKPADVVAFGNAERDRLLNTKTMAQRHLAESRRRAEQKAKDEHFARSRPSAEERQRQVQEALGRFRDGAKAAW
jgi:hypothetical protein